MSQASWQVRILRFVGALAAVSLLATPARAVTLKVTSVSMGYSPDKYIEGSLDVYVADVQPGQANIAAYELGLGITPLGVDAMFSGASATSGAHPPIIPGLGPTVIGTPGNLLRVVEFSAATLSDNAGLLRARFRLAPGAKGTFDVDLNPALTNLANQLGQAIPVDQLIGGHITVGNFLRGDVNMDGKVDLWDFGILKLNSGKPGTWEDGDLNGDGMVDMADFGLLKDSFGERAVHAQPSPTPEPSTAVLAGLALAALLMMRGRPR